VGDVDIEKNKNINRNLFSYTSDKYRTIEESE